MARTDTGAVLTRQHRQRQIAIRATTVREFMQLWPVWNPGDPRSFDSLVDATIPLVQLRRETSAGVASDYYRAFRTAEGVGGTSTPRLARAVERDRVAASLYSTGQAQQRRAVAAGFSAQAARQNTLVTVTGAVSRHVLDGGRETLLRSSTADRRTDGWRRVTAGNACAFCAMLASRGAVYGETTADFQSHDHCACSAEPRYAGSKMPDTSVRFREMWDKAQNGDVESGMDGDPLNRFRRALARS